MGNITAGDLALSNSQDAKDEIKKLKEKVADLEKRVKQLEKDIRQSCVS